MTASNKVDLIAKEDGSVEALLPLVEQGEEKAQTRKKKFPFVVTMLMLGVLLLFTIATLTFVVLHSKAPKSYEVLYSYSNTIMCGTVDFQPQEATESFSSENVITLTDGLSGSTAVKINVTTDGDPSFICLIRNDEAYGMAGPSIYPEPETLDSFMKETVTEGPLDVVMGKDYWMADQYEAVDFNKLPISMQRLCTDVPIYKMRPMTENELNDEEEDADNITNESSLENSLDDHDSFYKNGETIDDVYDSNTVESSDSEGDDTAKQAVPSTGMDYYFNSKKPGFDFTQNGKMQENNFDDLMSLIRASTAEDDGDNEIEYRRKRGVSPENNKKVAPKGSNSNSSEDVRSPNDNSSPSLNLGERQTDAELACCHHCTRGYLQCNRVCVPIQQNTYPYFYRSCDYVECTALLPCAWWRARAAGYV